MLKCPGCGDGEQILVTALVWVRLSVDAAGEIETDSDNVPDHSHTWDESSAAMCLNCDWTGQIAACGLPSLEEDLTL
jgi:hypothetical protein